MSQQQLAKRMGISFQQIQKYEKGTNQLSAYRLDQVCRILEVSVKYFFDGDDETGVPAEGSGLNGFSDKADTFTDPLSVRFLVALHFIDSPPVRKSLIDLVESIVDAYADPSSRSGGRSGDPGDGTTVPDLD